MPWHASLKLDYRHEGGRTPVRHQHQGLLRVLQPLYPEGDAICHNVLVHPPGGLVGGDELDIAVSVGPGAHGLITTPGASRFYRSDGELAVQRSTLQVAAGARLEWLPLEALCYSGCKAENRLTLQLEPGAEMMGWDVTALGLPRADLPFVQGSLLQHIEVPGVWLERGRIDATDHRLMDGPLGLAGYRCMATLFMVVGTDMPRQQREQALALAHAVIDAHALRLTAGVTAPNARCVVVRVLAPVTEPAMGLLRAVRSAWRTDLWQLPDNTPRIWAM